MSMSATTGPVKLPAGQENTFENKPFPQLPVSRPFLTPKMPPRPIAQPQPITPNRYTRTRVRPINQPTGPIVRPTNPAITNPNVRIGPGLPAPIQRPPAFDPKTFGVRKPGGPAPIQQPGYQFRQNVDMGKAPSFYIDSNGNPVTDQMIEAGQDPFVNNQRTYKNPINMGYQYNPAYAEWDKRNMAEMQARNTDIANFKKYYAGQQGGGDDYWMEGIDWNAGESYGKNGELIAGGRILKPDSSGAMIDMQTGERVYNAAPPSFVGRSQYDWKTLQPGQSAPTPSFGGGKSGVFGSAQPSPGGPYTPRPDLGPGVGFGPGLPQPQLEAMPYTDSTAPMQQSGMPGGKSNPIGNFIGSAASLIPNAIGNAAAQSQDPNAQRIAPLFTGLGGVMNQSFSNMGGKSGSAPNYQQTQATQQNPNVSIGMSGGFNPAAGNTTLPGNF